MEMESKSSPPPTPTVIPAYSSAMGCNVRTLRCYLQRPLLFLASLKSHFFLMGCVVHLYLLSSFLSQYYWLYILLRTVSICVNVTRSIDRHRVTSVYLFFNWIIWSDGWLCFHLQLCKILLSYLMFKYLSTQLSSAQLSSDRSFQFTSAWFHLPSYKESPVFEMILRFLSVTAYQEVAFFLISEAQMISS